jgi:hypothetical protein
MEALGTTMLGGAGVYARRRGGAGRSARQGHRSHRFCARLKTRLAAASRRSVRVLQVACSWSPQLADVRRVVTVVWSRHGGRDCCRTVARRVAAWRHHPQVVALEVGAQARRRPHVAHELGRHQHHAHVLQHRAVWQLCNAPRPAPQRPAPQRPAKPRLLQGHPRPARGGIGTWEVHVGARERPHGNAAIH